MAAYIDRVYRVYGEEHIGKDIMDHITDHQVEEARCASYEVLSALTMVYGKQPKDTCKIIFCDYIREYFL